MIYLFLCSYVENACSCITFTQATCKSDCRVLCNHQITRGRKRSTRNPSWFVQQQPSETDEDLTPENQEYLSELVQARYAQHKSPLKDGPWERGVWTTRC